MKTTITFVIASLLIGCASTSRVKQDVYSHLEAALSPDGASFKTNIEVELTSHIRNVSDSSIKVDTFPLGSSILSVEVFDSSGKRIPTVPPPTPLRPDAAARYVKILGPGRAISQTYSLYMFSPPLQSGTYTVRMRHIDSNEVTFTIREPMEN